VGNLSSTPTCSLKDKFITFPYASDISHGDVISQEKCYSVNAQATVKKQIAGTNSLSILLSNFSCTSLEENGMDMMYTSYSPAIAVKDIASIWLCTLLYSETRSKYVQCPSQVEIFGQFAYINILRKEEEKSHKRVGIEVYCN